MPSVKGKLVLAALGAAIGSSVATARADVTVEEGASILIFPKVIADGTRDTILQLTNISNDLVFVRCFYVNAQLTNPGLPEHPILNPPLWLETDFNIRLTRQQPTHWRAATGRAVDPFDSCVLGDLPTCVLLGQPERAARAAVPSGVDLDGLGIDPGAVPPLPPDFVGELKCIEVDASGAPIGGNHLKGEATLLGVAGQVLLSDPSKYNAIGIRGTELAGATGNDLQLNNGEDGDAGQYDACPAVLFLNHFAEGAEDPIIVSLGLGRRCQDQPATTCTEDDDCPAGLCVTGGLCDDNGDPCTQATDCNLGAACILAGVSTELTIVPCAQDFENQRPAEVTIQFKIWNEFEAQFSTSTSVVCWKNIVLTDIGGTNAFDRAVLGSDVALTVMTPADIGDGGFVAIAESIRRSADNFFQGRAAVNVHSRGSRFLGDDGTGFDHIILPDAQ